MNRLFPFPCCSEALMTRVELIFTTAGEAFSIMSAKEFDNELIFCTVLESGRVLLSARATETTGTFSCVATANAAIRPPPTEAATSVRIAVERRNWTTFPMSSNKSFPKSAIFPDGCFFLTYLTFKSLIRFPRALPGCHHFFPPLPCFGPEGEALTLRIHIHQDGLPIPDLARNDALRQRSFNFPLNGPF